MKKRNEVGSCERVVFTESYAMRLWEEIVRGHPDLNDTQIDYL